MQVDIWESDSFNLSVKAECPLWPVMIIFSLSESSDTMTEGYTPPNSLTEGYVMGNLIRLGLAAVIVLIMGGFLVEAWHSQRLSPNSPW